ITFPLQVIVHPPTSAPSGVADEVRTLETVRTRPNRRGGTRVCRRLMALMLKNMLIPMRMAQIPTATSYHGTTAKRLVRSPSTMSAPRSAPRNEILLRNGPASKENATAPPPPPARTNATAQPLE